jgi:hypothetical protein
MRAEPFGHYLCKKSLGIVGTWTTPTAFLFPKGAMPNVVTREKGIAIFVPCCFSNYYESEINSRNTIKILNLTYLNIENTHGY